MTENELINIQNEEKKILDNEDFLKKAKFEDYYKKLKVKDSYTIRRKLAKKKISKKK